VKGLLTEASPLNFPENFALDLDNVELFRDGSIKRRLGLSQNVDTSTTGGSHNVTAFLWENAGNDITQNIAVVQRAETFYFYDASAAGDLWDNLLTTTSLDSSITDQAQYATVDGTLFIFPWAARVEWTGSAISIPASEKYNVTNIKVRDFWGVEDLWNNGTVGSAPSNFASAGADGRDLQSEENIEYRPALDTNDIADISDAHIYNLFNQGWYSDARVIGSLVVNPVDYWAGSTAAAAPSTVGTAPSNSDVWWRFGQLTDSKGRFMEVSQGTEDTFSIGTPAPKGHYVIPFINRGTNRETLVEADYTLTVGGRNIELFTDNDSTGAVCGTGTGWAGRIFYGGFASTATLQEETTAPEISKYVLFSQVVDSSSDVFKCFQQNDPTAEDINDVLATDGGYIKIAEVDKILKLVPLRNLLLVIATNGVWAVKGSDEGFSATNFQVIKVTSAGALGASSVVDAEDVVAYWSRNGVYVVQPNELGSATATNVTEATIQTKYTDITNVAKEKSIGFFEAEGRRVRWMYSDESDYNPDTASNKFNRELVFDLVLQAWYTNTFDASGTDRHVAAYVALPKDTVLATTDAVTVSGVPVTAAAVPVTVPTTLRQATTGDFFYVVRDGTDMGFASTSNGDFEDWGDTDYTSFLETGYLHEGDASRDKKVVRLVTHFNRTETGFTDDGNGNLTPINESSCIVQARWDFSEPLSTNANDTASGQWSKQFNPVSGLWEAGGFEAYRYNRPYLPSGSNDPFDYGLSILSTKHKLRGKGKALRLRFTSSTGKDMQVVGWGLDMTGSGRM
jgi:hypothetical protein